MRGIISLNFACRCCPGIATHTVLHSTTLHADKNPELSAHFKLYLGVHRHGVWFGMVKSRLMLSRLVQSRVGLNRFGLANLSY